LYKEKIGSFYSAK